MTGSTSLLARSWKQKQTKIGTAIILVVLFIAIAGPWLAPYSATEFVGPPFTGSTSAAPLGTDVLGHDVLSRTLRGGLFVVWSSIAAAIVAMLIGVTLGLLAGYRGGFTDGLTMRGFDIVLAFPQLILVLIFVSLIGPKAWLIVLLTGIALSPGVARVTRGLTQEVAQRDFVRAAELMGMSRRRILWSEILPNLSSALLVEFTTRMIWAIGVIASLAFLGLGPTSDVGNWGLMINENRVGLPIQPLGVIAPVVVMAGFAVGTGLIAEGISRSMARIEGARTS
ncbi:MAG: peptide/nickel transport system permease protein [Actinomycetota bacterium]|jgi:peptide/nickel transport system permease protein|nr:peptide/nickel transport system permease protein [Actinomycetota bacterium]